VITSLTWLGHALVLSLYQQEVAENKWGVSRPPRVSAPAILPKFDGIYLGGIKTYAMHNSGCAREAFETEGLVPKFDEICESS